MPSSQRTLNQRIFCAEGTLPVFFDQLQASYDDHRDAEALDELVVPCIELRRRSHDMYYVLVHVAEATAQDQAIGYIAVDSIASSHLSSPPAQSLLHKLSRRSTSTTPRAQVIDHLPHDDVLRRHTFLAHCPVACVISAGLSVTSRAPSPAHGKPRSSWSASLMFWLLVGEKKTHEASVTNGRAAAVDQDRCALEHDFARRSGAAVWKAHVEQLEKEAREGRSVDNEKH